MDMGQYFVPIWLDVSHRKLKAEIPLAKETVRTAPGMFPCDHGREMPLFLSSPIFPSPPRQWKIIGTLAFKKPHLLSFYSRAIEKLQHIL